MRNLDYIVLVVVFLLGAGLVYSVMHGKAQKAESQERYEAMQDEINAIKAGHQEIIDIDSLQSAIEAKIIAKNDSTIKVLSEQLRLMKLEYKKLKQSDEDLQARLDSISVPVLPDF